MVLRERFETVKNEFNQYADQGYRVLVFGSYQGILSEALLEAEVIPLAYLLIANPIRKEALTHLLILRNKG